MVRANAAAANGATTRAEPVVERRRPVTDLLLRGVYLHDFRLTPTGLGVEVKFIVPISESDKLPALAALQGRSVDLLVSRAGRPPRADVDADASD